MVYPGKNRPQSGVASFRIRDLIVRSTVFHWKGASFARKVSRAQAFFEIPIDNRVLKQSRAAEGEKSTLPLQCGGFYFVSLVIVA